MIRVIARRLLTVIPTLLIVTLGVFMLIKLAPADPAVVVAGGITATQEDIDKVHEELHLDDPVLSQYWRWLSGAVQGDLGDSYIRKTSVAADLEVRIPVSLGLIGAAMVFALVVGIPLGILSGLRPNGGTDRGSQAYSALAVAVPNFLLATVLVVVFAVKLKWLPPLGYVKFSESPIEWLRYITLPAIALGVGISAAVTRQLRGALVDELDTNHIRTSWSIGGTSRTVVGRHGLKNASIPAITIIGLQITALVGGTVIMEQIFSIPGLGNYLLSAIVSADMPAVQGCVLLLVIVALAMSLATDILYSLLNPKVRVDA